MQITIDVVYEESTGKLNVHSEWTAYSERVKEDGTVENVVQSPELAFLELIRDVAFGIIDPATKSFWDQPINLVDEYEEYHKLASKKIASGEYGGNIEGEGYDGRL